MKTMILSVWKKTDKDRNCLIKIDDSVWGTLSEKALRTLFHYHVGSFDITETEALLLQEELLRTAWNNLLNWLGKQERSTFESSEYLKRQSFHPSIIESCITEAVSKHFIDNSRYCRLLIESLIIRNKSPRIIKAKLMEKRLPATLWEPLLSEMYKPQDKQTALREQAEIAYRRYRNLDKHACYEKCLTSLYRKGFDLDDASRIVADIVYQKQ
jgi:SOS response regulatory protein OraA/RecX